MSFINSSLNIFFILFVFGAIITIITLLSPLVLDDYVFKYVNNGMPFFTNLSEGAPEFNKVNFKEISTSVKNLYFQWNGRVIYHYIAYFFANIPKIFFDVTNGVMASILLWLILKIIRGKEPLTLGLTVTFASIFLLSVPAPGLTLFWFAGATNYLWTAVFYVAFLLPFRMAAQYGDICLNKFCKILIIIPIMICGIIGCNTIENTSGAIILLATMLSIYTYYKYKKIYLWQILGILSAFGSFLILVLSPGQVIRIATENHIQMSVVKSLIVQTAYLFQQLTILFPLVILLFIIIFLLNKTKKDNKLLVLPSIFVFGALVNCYIMILSPYSPSRTMFGSFILMLIALGMLYYLIKRYSIIDFPKMELLVALTLFLIVSPIMLYAFRDVYFTSQIIKQREVYAQQIIKEGVYEVTFRPVIGISKYNVLYKTDLLSPDPNHFVNRHIAKKLRLKKINISPPPAIVGMHKDIL